jgi:microcystin-dependent protein
MTRSLGKMVIPPWSAPPGSPDAGELYYDTDDGSFQWRDGVAATWRSALSHQLADAKGDLLAATGADVLARVPVGTNAHVLTADSTQALGLKWAAAPGAGVSQTPPGVIEMYGALTAPSGYSLCDGTARKRSGADPGDGQDYAALFAIVGTSYGVGDGSTTFNMPNLKGNVPVGRNSGDVSFDSLGEVGGAKTHTLTAAESAVVDVKVHDGSNVYNLYNAQGGTNAGYLQRPGTEAPNAGSTGSNVANRNTKAMGGGGAHNNLQPYIVVNFIIKL